MSFFSGNNDAILCMKINVCTLYYQKVMESDVIVCGDSGSGDHDDLQQAKETLIKFIEKDGPIK